MCFQLFHLALFLLLGLVPIIYLLNPILPVLHIRIVPPLLTTWPSSYCCLLDLKPPGLPLRLVLLVPPIWPRSS
jgi:hypothetical protein